MSEKTPKELLTRIIEFEELISTKTREIRSAEAIRDVYSDDKDAANVELRELLDKSDKEYFYVTAYEKLFEVRVDPTFKEDIVFVELEVSK